VSQREVVAREEEIAAVERFLSAEPEGTTLLLLEGEAGIGKSTLWMSAVALAEERAMRVLRCAPSEAEARLSFAALTDLLDDDLAEVLPRLAPPRARALESALMRASHTEVDPHGVGLGVLDALCVLSEAGPLLVAIDDWQWLDSPTEAALAFALRRLRRAPVRLLCAIRGGNAAQGPAAEFASVERMNLTPLVPGAIHTLLRERLGLSLSRPALLRVHAATGGNPFFALQMGEALAEADTEILAGEPLPVPADLRALLRKRLAGLDAEVKHVLRIAGVLGAPTVDTIAGVVGDPARARGSVMRGVEAGVLRLDREEVRFAHPLIGSAVMSTAVPDELRALHAAAAAHARSPEERARHLALASPDQDPEVAAALDAAAEEAAGRGAYGGAAELSDLALRATPAANRDDRVRRALSAAGYHQRSGDGTRAAAILERLINALPAGPQRADALNQLAALLGYESERNIALCEQAVREAGEDERLRARIHYTLAEIWATRGNLATCEHHAREATAWARRAGDDGLLTDALSIFGRALAENGFGPQRELMQEALAVAARCRPTNFEDPEGAFGINLLGAGEVEEAEPLLVRALEKALASGDTPSQCRSLMRMAELDLFRGRWDAAGRHSTEALALAEQIQVENLESVALYWHANIEAHVGRIDAAREHALRGVESSRAGDRYLYPLHQSVLGFAALSAGEVQLAVSYLAPVPDHIRLSAPRQPALFPVRALVAEALVAAGDYAPAAEIVAELEEDAARTEHAWGFALAGRSHALIAAAEGRLADAIVAAERALVWHGRVAIPFERARTLLVYGVIQRRKKLKRPARETLQQAAAIFEQLGAPLWLAQARVELGRVGGRQPTSEGVLTATEQRVAELAAAGRTNKQIAAELYLSERTVEANLTKVYRKLGLRSRAELASKWTGAVVA